MTRISIGGRLVGDAEPAFIVAEAGSNHNGSYQQALDLIAVAVEAGVDAVKFQHFKARTLYPRSAGESAYLRTPRSIYDIVAEMETPDEWVAGLALACRERGVTYLSTPFDTDAADLLDAHIPAFKVASYELTHLPLVRHIARKGKPMIVSTGAATLAEVCTTVDAIRAEGNDQIILLQCTASYPAPVDAMNLRAMRELRDATGCLVGLSDHSRDPVTAPVAAVALGACLIEKHFTLSNALPGPDHSFAIEPRELRDLVVAVRTTESMLGPGQKVVMAPEDELRSFARRSIFTTRDIPAGTPLDRSNTAILRCGVLGLGLDPDAYDTILGRTARVNIAAEQLVRPADLQ